MSYTNVSCFSGKNRLSIQCDHCILMYVMHYRNVIQYRYACDTGTRRAHAMDIRECECCALSDATHYNYSPTYLLTNKYVLYFLFIPIMNNYTFVLCSIFPIYVLFVPILNSVNCFRAIVVVVVVVAVIVL